MSLRRDVLNWYLRRVEKPRLAQAVDHVALRRSFEQKARLMGRPPWGSIREMVRVGPVYGLKLSPSRHHLSRAKETPLILYFHGGGYVFGSPRTHHAMVAHLLSLSGHHAVLPFYRLAPEFPFPAAVQDAVAAYQAVEDHPGGVVLGGDSAGGGLALSLLAEILRLGAPRPLGVFAFSPWTDLTGQGASLSENAEAEVMLPAARVAEIVGHYIGHADPADPRASPVFADFKGAPPVWLSASRTEILRDDTLRMAHRLEAGGGVVTLHLEDDLPHAWPYFCSILPEARSTLRDLAGWIMQLPRPADS